MELLLCSTIATLLLMATAVAFRATVMAYRDNTDRNLLLSQGRVAMRELIGDVRQADAHGPVNDAAAPNAVTLFAQGNIIENSGIQYLKTRPDPSEPSIVPGNAATYVLVTWQYDAPNLRITRTRSVGGGTPVTSVMANYIQDFKVRLEPGRSSANVTAGNPNYDILTRAVVAITMQNVDATGKMLFNQGNGLVTERILDAVVPRKNFPGL